jgi:hypothetical protein
MAILRGHRDVLFALDGVIHREYPPSIDDDAVRRTTRPCVDVNDDPVHLFDQVGQLIGKGLEYR